MSHTVNLRKETVLVLNKNWQAIHVKNPADAMCMMFDDVATGLDIISVDNMVPYKWDDWVQLPINENDQVIKTVRGEIKVPKVIVLCKYNQVPRKRPKFSSRSIWERDGGTCQYTGVKLKPGKGNIDHVLPKSRGGKTSWDNCVLSCQQVNAAKADKTPNEAGLKLLRAPQEPKAMPTVFYIRNRHNIPEWDIFLKCYDQ